MLVSYKEAPKLQLPGDTYNQGWQKSTPHNEEAALNFPQFFSCVCTCMCLCMYTDTHTHIVCVCQCVYDKQYLLNSIKKESFSEYAVAGCFHQGNKEQQAAQRQMES